MSITIYGLDNDYSDCALDMGSKIYYFHDGVIDCKFPETVDISTDDTRVYISDRVTTASMSLGFDEFFTIQID